MKTGLFDGKTRICANAVLLADRIDNALLDVTGRLATTPLTIRAGSAGCAMVFRYGTHRYTKSRRNSRSILWRTNVLSRA